MMGFNEGVWQLSFLSSVLVFINVEISQFDEQRGTMLDNLQKDTSAMLVDVHEMFKGLLFNEYTHI